MIFRGKTQNSLPITLWKAIYKACCQFEQFVIEVTKFDPDKQISYQQMKWWHCQPVTLYSQHTGCSLWESEQWLKRECGEHFFMQSVCEQENRRGLDMWECRNPNCRHLFRVPKRTPKGLYVCPNEGCFNADIRQFFMLSKTEIGIKDFNEIMKNASDFLGSINCPCPMPDKNWRINKES